MKPAPTLEKWLRFHDTFVGWIWDHPKYPNGTHWQTGAIRPDKDGRDMVDYLNMELHCAEGMYKLGEPGTMAEHDGPGYLGDLWRPSLFVRAKKLLLVG